MAIAVEALARHTLARPLVLAPCASEESGALTAARLAPQIANVGAIVVGEPTGGRVPVAHKGVAWIRVRCLGVAAHASTPHLDSNAIATMAHALDRLKHLRMVARPHPDLTVNVDTIIGGEAPSVVTDRCETTFDVRPVPGFEPDDAVAAIRGAFGYDAEISVDVALPALNTSPSDEWLCSVFDGSEPCGVNYLTHASVLAPSLGYPPVAITGPGEPGLAHQVDECGSVAAIAHAAELYRRTAISWTSPKGDAL